MAYGRLDVYWPDGRLESYMLAEQTVSVGRAEGNTIALDTETISRYHFSLLHDDNQVLITDLESVNGTFVDGVQLVSNQTRPLGAVEEIQVGSLRIIFRKFDDTPTIPLQAYDEETARIDRDEAAYHVEVDHTQFDVWPAASSSAELGITNTGDDMRRFAVRVNGMPGEWLRVNRPDLTIASNETAYVLINIKPPRRPDTQPRQYHVQVEVLPTDSPELPVHVQLTVNLRAYAGFGVALVPQMDVDEPVQAFLHNQGSAPIAVSLSATDPRKALKFQLPSAPMQLQPGQRLRVDIHATAHNPPLTGAPVTYPFILQVRSHGTSGFLAATPGNMMIAPRFPVWALVSAGGIAISILILLILAASGVLTPPDPQIDDLAVSAQQVEAGEELLVTWSAEDVETVRISVNQQLVADGLPGDTESYPIDTSNYDGFITIGIFGETGSLTANREIAAEVIRPIEISNFNTQPETLVRNVVSTLTITWDVPGADRVILSGLELFTTGRIADASSFPAQHTLTESGLTDSALNLTLLAEDDDGAIVDRELSIPVVDAVCTATNAIALHEGPDPRYQEVSNVVEDVAVVVLAQDADAGWLRVQLPDDNVRAWGPRDAFACGDNFAISDLRVESNIPVLPPASPTPRQTTIPQATPGG